MWRWVALSASEAERFPPEGFRIPKKNAPDAGTMPDGRPDAFVTSA
jgi:hypothetical protein